MKTIFAIALAACAVTLGDCAAQAPAEQNLPTTGQVLLLKNQRILEGEVMRDGPRFRIRRRIGESTVDASQVLMVCSSRAHAYQHLRSLANQRDPDEHLRLARWCQFHGLLDEGLREARAALEAVPKNTEAQRLVRSFERALCQPSTPGTAEEAAPVQPEPEPEIVLSVPLNLACLTQFNHRVQPVLMNACSTCHVAGRGGAFHLRQTFGQSGLHGRSTRSNVASAVEFIDFEQWQRSPLLVKAVGVHGGIDRPPLEGKQVAAFQVLEGWVKQVVESSPRPATPSLDPSPIVRAPEPKGEPIFASAAKPTPAPVPPQSIPEVRTPPITPAELPELKPLAPADNAPLGNREIHSITPPPASEVGLTPLPSPAQPQPMGTPNAPPAPVVVTPPAPVVVAPPPPVTQVPQQPVAVASPAPVAVAPPAPQPVAVAPHAPVAIAPPVTVAQKPVTSPVAFNPDAFAVGHKDEQPRAKPSMKLEALQQTPDDPFDPVIFNRQMHGAQSE